MKIGKCIIGFDFVIALTALYLLDTGNTLYLALLSALVHELGHILAIKLCGARIERIFLGAYGAKIKMCDLPIISYKREIIIALAGPFAGAIFGLISIVWGNYTLAGLNLILSVFNLIPALPLDGGRAVKNWALLIFDEEQQKTISMAWNIVSALFLIGLCIWVNVKVGISPSLCIFCAFTVGNFLKELF